MKPDFYAIGRVTKPSGLKGDLIVQPLTDDPKRFLSLKKVWIGRDNSEQQPYGIEKIVPRGSAICLRLKEIQSRDEAETLVKKLIWVTKENVARVPEGAYFIHDIIGSTVINSQRETIGTVAEVWKLPANDVYVVRNGDNESLIPALRSVIKCVDTKKKRIEIEEIDGLLD